MKIYYNETYIEVLESDNSYRFEEIMGDNLISLEFSLVDFVDFPIGAYVLFENQKYVMYDVANFTKINERRYDYQISFYAAYRELERYKFRNTIDGRLNFTITAQPQEFLKHIVDNLNLRDSDADWEIGDCIVSAEKTQSFSHNSIKECLDSVANLFETEWRIENKKVSLCKAEYGKNNPLALSYGRGNGFKSGVSQKLSGDSAVDVLFVQGGDRNIDSQNYTYIKDGEIYHANALRLPRNKHGWYLMPQNSEEQGEIVYRKPSDDVESIEFETDADGFSVKRKNYINNGFEDSLELTDIYPSHTLTISKVTNSNPDKHFWEIYDDKNVIDYKQEDIIEGETMTLIFQDGMLVGKEFDISSYNHKEKKFEIVPQEIDGIIMPDRASGYYPQANQTFAVFHMNLPQQYITEAENKMLLQSLYYLNQRGEIEVDFQGTIDGIWAKKNWEDIFNRIQLGYYIRFFDNAFAREGKNLRIKAVKTFLNNPHSPELTLSNSSTTASVSSTLKKLAQNQVYQEKLTNDSISYNKRNFRSAKETAESISNYVQKLDNYNFSGSINPSTISTMMAIVGDENLQFTFGLPSLDSSNKVINWQNITFAPQFNNGSVDCVESYIRHETFTSNYGIMTGQKAAYPYWHIVNKSFTGLDPEKAYYLYVVAPKSAKEHFDYCITEAVFEASEETIAESELNYYLLVGIINTEYNGERTFASLFGKTEILPNSVITDKIVSNDGNSFFDLTTGEFRGDFKFTNENSTFYTQVSGDTVVSTQLFVKNQDNPPLYAGLDGTDNQSRAIYAGATWNETDQKLSNDSTFEVDFNGETRIINRTNRADNIIFTPEKMGSINIAVSQTTTTPKTATFPITSQTSNTFSKSASDFSRYTTDYLTLTPIIEGSNSKMNYVLIGKVEVSGYLTLSKTLKSSSNNGTITLVTTDGISNGEIVSSKFTEKTAYHGLYYSNDNSTTSTKYWIDSIYSNDYFTIGDKYKDKYLFLGWGDNTYKLSVQVKLTRKDGQEYKMNDQISCRVSCNFTSSTDEPITATLIGLAAFNKIYPDGIFLSKASNQYVGLNARASDDTIFKAQADTSNFYVKKNEMYGMVSNNGFIIDTSGFFRRAIFGDTMLNARIPCVGLIWTINKTSGSFSEDRLDYISASVSYNSCTEWGTTGTGYYSVSFGRPWGGICIVALEQPYGGNGAYKLKYYRSSNSHFEFACYTSSGTLCAYEGKVIFLCI